MPAEPPPPVLSAVVPLFNCLSLTQAMVASLQATLPAGLEHEIILVDDGSTDGTGAWLAGLGPPFRAVRHERNLGYAASNNDGAALARGEFLVLLNNDLVLLPGWLEPMIAACRRLGDKAGAIGNVQIDARTGAVDHAGMYIDHRGKPTHRRSLGRGSPDLLPVDLMTGACLLVRRDLWVALDGFDAGYVNGCEDVDFCFRAAAAGKVNAIARRSAVRHHVSASPGRNRNNEANTYRLFRRWRETIVRLGVPDWCRCYPRSHRSRPGHELRLGLGTRLQALLFRFGLRRTPPAGAARGMAEAVEIEFARWRQMFGE